MATPIASYFASIQFRIPQGEIRKVDKHLKGVEKQLTAFQKRINKQLTLDIKLPAIKIKAFKIDELALQRNSQMSLNRVSRLLTLDIRNFNFDQSKITRQMQGVMQRAANASRINVRSIQGSSGGSNAYFPQTKVSKAITQYASPHHQSPVMASARDTLAGAGMALLPGRLAMFSGPALAVAAPVGAGIGIERQAVALGNEQAAVEQKRTQLDVASGAKNRIGMDRQNQAFFDLANRTGSNAESLISSYAQMMKTLQAIGLTPEKSFNLYKDMSLFAKSTGAGDQQMDRASYAIGQIYGKGFVSREEMQLQLADALPSFKKYLMDVYADNSGIKGGAAFDKALTNKEVTTQMLEEAFRRAALAGMGNVERYANTVQAEQARLANIQLQEQMSRTLSDDVIPSMRKYVEAQNELYTAMQPFRNLMYDASAAILSFNANLLKKSAPMLNEVGKKLDGSSIVRDPLTYLPALNPVTSTIQLGYLANKHLMGGEDQSSLAAPSPLIPKGYSWKSQADHFYDITKAIPKSNTNNVTVGDVNISFNSNATNGQQLADELKFVVRQELKDAVTGALQNYPQLE